MEAKYNRAYAKVDLDAIEYNIVNLKKYIGNDVKIMAVIKADGYGHGAIPLCKIYQELGIDYLAVAIYQEGVELRKEGIKIPILVLGNTTKEAFSELIEYDLIQSIYTYDMAYELNNVAKRLKKRAKAHIKIDTGMGRIGFRNNAPSEIKKISKMKNLELEGIFTHFARADEYDKTYTDMQINRFERIIDILKKEHIEFKSIHAANSAGTLVFKKAYYNMVRLGIVLYGLYPSDQVEKNVDLKPALSIISHVVHLKTLPKGERISYGGTYTTTKDTKVATIPIGYADGYSRALSNKGRVVINNQYAPIIGKVCMDQLMIDVTDVEKVELGTEVYLIGGTKDAYVSVDEIAEIMGTINYEVICLIGKRIPRVYIKNNEIVDKIDYFKI